MHLSSCSKVRLLHIDNLLMPLGIAMQHERSASHTARFDSCGVGALVTHIMVVAAEVACFFSSSLRFHAAFLLNADQFNGGSCNMNSIPAPLH